MKAALYLEDGTTEVVLTPENDFDRAALAAIEKVEGAPLRIRRGQFYHTRGGWVAHSQDPESLMLVVARPTGGA